MEFYYDCHPTSAKKKNFVKLFRTYTRRRDKFNAEREKNDQKLFK